MNPTPPGWPRISSALYYKDAGQALDWLCEAFGFELRLKVEGEGGRIEHSELVLPGGLVFVGESGDKGRLRNLAPADVDGGNTQNMFAYVDDVAAHLAQARAAGATIVGELRDSDHGEAYWADRSYECLDPGGHRWWFAQRLHDGPRLAPKLDARDVGTPAPPTGWPRISSSVYYPDAGAAIAWLCEAFGFEIQIKVEGEDGKVAHSELVFGGGLVMVSERDRAQWPDRRAPIEIDGANTQNLMIFVDDVKLACERARSAGATIVQEPQVSDYGEDYWSDLSCEVEDLGGHRWWLTQRLRG
jgi:uncharacterized glyoxalase superfamily protein PhnB